MAVVGTQEYYKNLVSQGFKSAQAFINTPTLGSNKSSATTTKSPSQTVSSFTSLTSNGGSNPITGSSTTKSQDTIALESLQKELAFNRIKSNTQEADQSQLRIQQRKAAVASADFQKQSDALSIKSRTLGIGRDVAALSRTSRQVQAQILSGSAGSGNLRSSSARGAAVAASSNLKREQTFMSTSESIAKEADMLRQQQVEAGLQATLTSLTDPTKVQQDAAGQVFVGGKLESSTQVQGGAKTFTSSNPATGIYAPAQVATKPKVDNSWNILAQVLEKNNKMLR